MIRRKSFLDRESWKDSDSNDIDIPDTIVLSSSQTINDTRRRSSISNPYTNLHYDDGRRQSDTTRNGKLRRLSSLRLSALESNRKISIDIKSVHAKRTYNTQKVRIGSVVIVVVALILLIVIGSKTIVVHTSKSWLTQTQLPGHHSSPTLQPSTTIYSRRPVIAETKQSFTRHPTVTKSPTPSRYQSSEPTPTKSVESSSSRTQRPSKPPVGPGINNIPSTTPSNKPVSRRPTARPTPIKPIAAIDFLPTKRPTVSRRPTVRPSPIKPITTIITGRPSSAVAGSTCQITASVRCTDPVNTTTGCAAIAASKINGCKAMNMLYSFKVCNLDTVTTAQLLSVSTKLNGSKFDLAGILPSLTLAAHQCKEGNISVSLSNVCTAGDLYWASLWVSAAMYNSTASPTSSANVSCSAFSRLNVSLTSSPSSLTVTPTPSTQPSRIPSNNPVSRRPTVRPSPIKPITTIITGMPSSAVAGSTCQITASVRCTDPVNTTTGCAAIAASKINGCKAMNMLYSFKVCNLDTVTTAQLLSVSTKLNGSKFDLAGILPSLTLAAHQCKEGNISVSLSNVCTAGDLYWASLWVSAAMYNSTASPTSSANVSCSAFSRLNVSLTSSPSSLTVTPTPSTQPSRIPSNNPVSRRPTVRPSPIKPITTIITGMPSSAVAGSTCQITASVRCTDPVNTTTGCAAIAASKINGCKAMNMLYSFKVCNLDTVTTAQLLSVSTKLNGSKFDLAGILPSLTLAAHQCKEGNISVSLSNVCTAGDLYWASLWVSAAMYNSTASPTSSANVSCSAFSRLNVSLTSSPSSLTGT